MAELEHDWSLLEALAPELLDLCLSFVSGCDIAALGCTSTLWRCRAFEQRWDWWHGACCREFVPVLVLGSREPVAYLGDLAWWKAEYARRYLYTLARCCMCFAASARPFAVWQLGRYRLCARCCSTEEQLLTADKCRAKFGLTQAKMASLPFVLTGRDDVFISATYSYTLNKRFFVTFEIAQILKHERAAAAAASATTPRKRPRPASSSEHSNKRARLRTHTPPATRSNDTLGAPSSSSSKIVLEIDE